MSIEVRFTSHELQEVFNALLERQHRLAMELRHHRDDLKDWELKEAEEALEGTQSALEVLKAGGTARGPTEP